MSGISFAKQIKSSKTLTSIFKPIANVYLKFTGYRQMGLRYDDLIPEENDEMETTLKRLSNRESYDRVYRLKRAAQLSLSHQILSKTEAIKPDEDVRYIKPILEQVEAEKKEREEWDTMAVKRK